MRAMCMSRVSLPTYMFALGVYSCVCTHVHVLMKCKRFDKLRVHMYTPYQTVIIIHNIMCVCVYAIKCLCVIIN